MMTKELTIEKKEVNCPHCRKRSSEVLVCEWVSSYSTHYIYFCVNCNKQLSMSRKDRQKESRYSA